MHRVRRCYKCGKQGHVKAVCKSKQKEKESHARDHKEKKHHVRDYRKRQAHNVEVDVCMNSESESKNEAIAKALYTFISTSEINQWILDFGVFVHFTMRREELLNY